MRPERRPRFTRALEWALFLAGVASLVWYGWSSIEVGRLETENRKAVERMLADRVQTAADTTTAVATPAPLLDADELLIGELDIPRLGLSAAVMAGDDDGVLSGAVGYLPDTALPWEPGNSVLAAHRDRLFRPLERIRIGDEIQLSTRHGEFAYHVVRTFVVSPRDVWIVNPVPGVDLTLITCYPFVFVGHAPQRFVVRARKLGP